MRRVAMLCVLLTGLTPQVRAQSAAAPADLTAAVAASDKVLGTAARTHGAMQALQSLYADNAGTLLWIRDGQPTRQAQALLTEVQEADSYGLRAQDYGAAELAGLLASPAPAGVAAQERLIRLDVRLSAVALRFICDLHFGRVSPEAAGFKLQEPREPYDLAQAVRSVAETNDVAGSITAVEPAFFHYKLLKDALAQYRKIATKAAPAALTPIAASVQVGDRYAGAPALRALLEVLGDLPPGDEPADPGILDARLSAGVRHFQDRHGLGPDGVLGKSTLVALQTPVAQRIRQISLTLERWRWLPPFKTPPIIVNIPQFQLFAFRTTEDRVAEILQMEVIVGRTFTSTQTPVFEGDMRYVVLRPYWDVPASIVRKEMLAKIHANPGYLARERLELVDGPSDDSPVVAPTPANIEALAEGRLRLRQQPGEDNALGLAKFIFPNSYNVYLHSTPAHKLFSESQRAFSHGCIRVADPLALATLVLQDAEGDWTREKIAAVMNGKQSVRINLVRPINVLILYATALATEAGPVLFFDDIYGYDRRLERQLGLPAVH